MADLFALLTLSNNRGVACRYLIQIFVKVVTILQKENCNSIRHFAQTHTQARAVCDLLIRDCHIADCSGRHPFVVCSSSSF